MQLSKSAPPIHTFPQITIAKLCPQFYNFKWRTATMATDRKQYRWSCNPEWQKDGLIQSFTTGEWKCFISIISKEGQFMQK
jgi:hypothetical protein